MKSRISIIIFIAALAIIFFAFDLQHYLTLEYLKSSRTFLQNLFNDYPVKTSAAFFFIYVFVVAVNLPGATVLGLAGGAIFGFITGTLLISFASSIGATIGCFVSRYIFRNFVEMRFKEVYDKINKGIESEGPFYLFTMRLIPAIPFVVINLVMGLTKMPLKTFYWVSQIGMLPGTMVYANAGNELGKIHSAKAVFSPELIISFLLLGLFPLIVKKVMKQIRKRRSSLKL
ncbi:TVP38/TMEM64 family protein [Maridesulfovibrio bastinii]|uniref:TVP38/TMEM64 family protein n=1 Tax=Maridesulfovibrio bastinii TaxID=47157 RepID=UPI0004118A9B|nr:TVP38/TMEM64 family protein [Maridesulfovibrio bastinii]